MAQLAITARANAGAVARRAVATWIAGHPQQDDALLAVTELVPTSSLTTVFILGILPWPARLIIAPGKFY